jgi:hypothetical protein
MGLRLFTMVNYAQSSVLVNLYSISESVLYSQSKAIPVTDCGGLYGFVMLRIPHLLESRPTDGGKFVSLMH